MILTAKDGKPLVDLITYSSILSYDRPVLLRIATYSSYIQTFSNIETVNNGILIITLGLSQSDF